MSGSSGSVIDDRSKQWMTDVSCLASLWAPDNADIKKTNTRATYITLVVVFQRRRRYRLPFPPPALGKTGERTRCELCLCWQWTGVPCDRCDGCWRRSTTRTTTTTYTSTPWVLSVIALMFYQFLTAFFASRVLVGDLWPKCDKIRKQHVRSRNNSKIYGSQQDYLVGKTGSPQIYVVIIWPRFK